MGYALAHAALKAGHNVTLITAIENPKSEIRNPKLKVINVETAAQMFDAVKRHFPRCDCLIMAAAVADYTRAHPAKTKIKKQNKPLTIKLKPTPDILKWAGAHKNPKFRRRRLVVGFALEDRNLRQNAEKKLRNKNLDMIIANTPAAIGKDKSAIQVKTLTGDWLKLPSARKEATAVRLVRLIEKLFR